MIALLVAAAVAVFPLWRRLVHAEAIAKAEAQLSAETEAFLRAVPR